MAISYALLAKTKRLEVIRDLIDAGSGPGWIELSGNDSTDPLHVVTLERPCGVVTGDLFEFSGLPITSDPPLLTKLGLPITKARILDGDGQVIVEGLNVGGPNSGASLELEVEVPMTKFLNGITIQKGAIRHG